MAKAFLDTIEEIREGASNINSGWEQGFTEVRKTRKNNPKYLKGLNEAVKFVNDIRGGKYGSMSPSLFREAMSSNDFPLYFGDILDRSVLAAYNAAGVNWRQISQTGTVGDFRKKNIFDFSGPDSYLDETIPESGEYKSSTIGEGKRQYRVYKRGRIFPIKWETLINDDLEVFNKVPQWFATAATRTEERFHTGLYADSSGPNSDLYTAPGASVTNGNLGTGILSVNNLGIAIASMGMMVDPDNEEPIMNRPQFLIVPPALELTAKRILNSVNLVWEVIENASDGASSVKPFPTQNFLRNELTLIVNPYLPIMDTTTGNSAWYLFAAPSEAPATEVGFLQGYEAPQIFIKTSNQQRVGGGTPNPMDGSFEGDEIKYKVRHILGGTQVRKATNTEGSIATFASNGTTNDITEWPDNSDVDQPAG